MKDLEELQKHGISKQDVDKLRAAGIGTIKGLQMRSRKRLLNLKGMSKIRVDKITKALTKVMGKTRLMAANEVRAKSKGFLKVSTASEAFDNILGGGIESMYRITEAYGDFRGGQTELSHALCSKYSFERSWALDLIMLSCSVFCQMDKPGYAGEKAIFIDTENTFRPDRLRSIARRFGLKEEEALENVFYVRAFTSDEQLELLGK